MAKTKTFHQGSYSGTPGTSPEYPSGRTSDSRDIESLARWMDTVFEIPGLGIRFGLDAILGLLPGAGDFATSAASIYILTAAQRHGVSRATLARMALNIMVDLVFGAVPFIGDIFDVYWKSNQRNVELLRRHMAATPQAEFKLQKSDRLFVWILVGIICVLTLASVVVAYFAVTWLAGALKSLTG
jgi:hypothetical protein